MVRVSTALKAITGLVRPNGGNITIGDMIIRI